MKYVFAIVVVFIVAIITGVLIFSGPRQPVPTTPSDIKTLADFADTPTTATYEAIGEVNAQEEHRIIRISVSRERRVLEIVSGYDNRVEQRTELSNTQSAYDQFLRALDGAGFDEQRESTFPDERGVCPLGRRFIYSLREGSEEPIRTWSTSCSSKQGTFNGSASTVRRLFQAQIPDYSRLVRGVQL